MRALVNLTPVPGKSAVVCCAEESFVCDATVSFRFDTEQESVSAVLRRHICIISCKDAERDTRRPVNPVVAGVPVVSACSSAHAENRAKATRRL